MTIETRARVEVTLEIQAGVGAWSDKEPGLGRAFNEAKEDALRTLNRVIAGEPLKGERRAVRLVKVSSVELHVTERGEP